MSHKFHKKSETLMLHVPFILTFHTKFITQAGPPPVEIFTDMEEMTHKDYLRVTIRTKGTLFKGFLVKAVEVLNTDTQCQSLKLMKSLRIYHL